LGLEDIFLTGTVYDFANANTGLPQAHRDFNSFLCGVSKGMVKAELGDDNKPVLNGNGNGCVTSSETFDQWFRPTEGVNEVFENIPLAFHWDDNSKAYKFSSGAFFPIDGKGFGNEWYGHNYGFCFEFHSSFTYSPEQVFDFMGDDDVWVFIDRQLAIDLGGVHSSVSQSVQLNSLGLTEGNTYPLDFFFCERHVTESNLMISTSIVLDPCGTTDTDGDGYPDLCDPCPQGDQVIKMWTGEKVGANHAVTFYLAPAKPQTNSYSVSVDFGDGTTQDFDVTNEMSFVHTYGKSGEYTVTFTGDEVKGCGTSPSGEITVNCSGKRLAPKCSEFSIVPGSPQQRKRSL
jgi:fibro-slime domain-containing protein